MKHSISWLRYTVLVVPLALPICGAYAQELESGKSKAGSGRMTEQAMTQREALNRYLAELQSVSPGSARDQELREKVIGLIAQLKPAPALPDEVVRHEGRAEAAARSAKTAADFMAAADEYRKASLLAPWVASYYFNLGIVLEKAENYGEAIRNFELYLLAAPNAPDTVDVKKKIAGLEYGMEKTAKAKVAEKEQQSADERLATQLIGTWRNPNLKFTNPSGQQVIMLQGYRIQIRVVGTKVTVICIGASATDVNMTKFWYGSLGLPLPYIDGKIYKGRLVGTRNQIWTSSDGAGILKTEPLDMKIEMSSDEKWFKLGDVDWNAWKEGADWVLFYGKE